MNNQPDEDELLVDMLSTITFDVLQRVGHNPDLRFEFFRRFVALAKDIAMQARKRDQMSS